MLLKYKFQCAIPCLCLLLAARPLIGSDYPRAQLTAKIVDEQGEPVKGAEVWISFAVAKVKEWGDTTIRKDGFTDSNGLFTADGVGAPGVGVYAQKEGFYSGGGGYQFKSRSPDNKWEPWNPTVEIVLKKERKPVSMYSKHTGQMKVPIVGGPIGYDLEKGDWVLPYGRGITSDFKFTYNTSFRAMNDYECSLHISFSNSGDGIQEYIVSESESSTYPWPFEAPEAAYSSILEKYQMFSPSTGYKSNRIKDARYIFRVRTRLDGKGNVIEAKYGKISGEFDFGADGKMAFSYHFNPDGTRNLECDPKIDLFHWSREEESKHRLSEP